MNNDILNGLLQYDDNLIEELHNTSFYIVDDIMGSGKTSAAINMINSQKYKEKYIYVVPYLDEVQRIINACNIAHFKEPKKYGNKLNGLKELLKKGENIVTTHALFHLFDNEVINICKKQGYTLIMDEVTEVIDMYELNKKDLYAFSNEYVHTDEYGFLIWDYKNIEDVKQYDKSGKFSKEKQLCKIHSLITTDKSKIEHIYKIFPIQIFLAFKEIYILTYMFKGQIQKYYYDLFNIDYKYLHVIGDNINNYHFETGLKTVDKNIYKDSINILENSKINNIGGILGGTEKSKIRKIYGITNLSKSWYSKNIKNSKNQLHSNIVNYFRNITHSKSGDNLWTTFKEYKPFLTDKGYTKSFTACNARGTNKFGDRHNVAYTVNVYLNPMIKRFFIDNNIPVNEDLYALSSMLQFIWRSAIRNKEHINLYIPSIRMRTLLKNWLNGNGIKNNE